MFPLYKYIWSFFFYIFREPLRMFQTSFVHHMQPSIAKHLQLNCVKWQQPKYDEQLSVIFRKFYEIVLIRSISCDRLQQLLPRLLTQKVNSCWFQSRKNKVVTITIPLTIITTTTTNLFFITYHYIKKILSFLSFPLPSSRKYE